LWNSVRQLLAWRRTRRIVGISALVYVVLYLYGLGDWQYGGQAFRIQVSDRAGEVLFRPMGPFQFEPLALLESSWITFLFSPVNVVIALVLGLLVGLNIAYAYVALAYRTSCSVASYNSGLLGSTMGLIAGSACCGPTIFLVLGVQATASVMAVFGWLIPLAGLFLLATLWWNTKRVHLPSEAKGDGKR
jgi:hypothetical protein